MSSYVYVFICIKLISVKKFSQSENNSPNNENNANLAKVQAFNTPNTNKNENNSPNNANLDKVSNFYGGPMSY